MPFLPIGERLEEDISHNFLLSYKKNNLAVSLRVSLDYRQQHEPYLACAGAN